MGSLDGKVAIIVGGAGGIGSETCRLFLTEGAKVAVGDIQQPAFLDQYEDDQVVYRHTDARSADDVNALAASALERWKRVDILFNNAGRSCRGSVLDVEESDFDEVFETNVKSTYHGCRAVLPTMLAQNSGSIINMSSNGGVVARANDPVYSASKHAVIGMTKSMAVTYAYKNIRVNAVCPGPIDTPMLRKGAVSDAEFESRLPLLLGSCPAGRYGSAREVASAVRFLASDESAFVNGLALTVDGGKGAAVLPNDRYRWVPAVGFEAAHH